MTQLAVEGADTGLGYIPELTRQLASVCNACLLCPRTQCSLLVLLNTRHAHNSQRCTKKAHSYI